MKSFFIDLLPEYASWGDWQAQVSMLLAEQGLPLIADEDQWQEFASALQDTPLFSGFGLPVPETFNAWQDWANNLLVATNGVVHG